MSISAEQAKPSEPNRLTGRPVAGEDLWALRRYGQLSVALGVAALVAAAAAAALGYAALRNARARLDALEERQVQLSSADLTVSGVRVTRFASPDRIDYQLVIHDQGLTPATAVSNRATSQIVDAAGDHDVPIVSYAWQTPTADPDVGQGQSRLLNGTYTLGSGDREAFRAGEKQLAVYGTFFYQDVFDRHHWVDFCYLLSSFNADHAGDDAKAEGTSCRNHNGRGTG